MRLRLRDSSALAAGSVVSGILAYVFFATTTRALGPEAASPVSVLWTYWSFSAAALTFPAQHWIARSVALHQDESDVRSALPRLSSLLVLVALLVGLLSWLARDELFHRDGLAFPALMAVVTLGSGVMGLARGTLTGRRRFGSVAAFFVAENSARCLGAVLLVLGGVKDPVAYGAALIGGHLVVVMWPSSLRLGPSTDRATQPALRFISGASGGQLLAQAVLTGGPVVLALGGGTAVEVTAMFAGLALFRAPYTISLGLVSQLTGLFTTLVAQDRRTTLVRARRLIVCVVIAAAAVAAAVGATAGPGLVRLIFGPDVLLESQQTMLLAVGSAVALGNLVLTVLLLALNRSAGVARGWLVSCLATGVFFAVADIAPLDRTCWAFLLAQAGAFVVLLVEESRGRSRLPLAAPGGQPSVAPTI
jgi:O-antigen/teichoic acid export membrane protein